MVEEGADTQICRRDAVILRAELFPQLPVPRLLTMASSQQQKGRDGVLTTLDLSIQALNIAKDACGIPPAQVALGSASVLLTMIRVRFSSFREHKPLTLVVQDTMANDKDYVELGEACGEVCQALYQRLKGRRSDELNQSVLGAIGTLTA